MSVAAIVGEPLSALSRRSLTSGSGGGSFADVLSKASAANPLDTTNTTSKAELNESERAELESQAESLLSEFNRDLRQILLERGVDLSEPLKLEADGVGGLRVSNNHADQFLIQEALKVNPDLAEKFDLLRKIYSKLRDPETTDPSSLFQPKFTLTITGDKAQAGFE